MELWFELWSIIGWFREQFNLPVNKLVGCRYVGSGLSNLGGNAGKLSKRYRAVWRHYFGDGERFYKRKGCSFELHLENEVYEGLGKVRMFFVDVVSGKPLGFWDSCLVAYAPGVLDEMLDTEDVKSSVRAAKRGDINWLYVVLGGVVGAMAMFALKDYIPAAAGFVLGLL